MKLVMLHGRDQQGKDPQQLRQQWLAALEVGLERAGLPALRAQAIEFPYYGDRLDELVKQLDAPLVADVRAKGGSPDDGQADFRGQLLQELATAAGISEQEIQAAYRGQATEKGPLNWEWVQAILEALDRTPMGRLAVDLFTRDVYVYLNHPEVAESIHAIVDAALGQEPCVLVAHSLGSIVAYRMLRDARNSAQVRRLITLGSPLGVRAIRRMLTPPSLARPAGVGPWLNAYDPRDVVALIPLDASTWDVRPPIVNKADVDNHTSNRHSIGGYLDDPTVATWIHEGLRA